MAKKKQLKKLFKKKNDDLNDDKKLDLVEEVKKEESPKEREHVAICDINLKYRKGDKVPASLVDAWNRRQINVKALVK